VDAWLKGETKKYIAELFRIQGSSSALLLSGNSVPSDGKEPSSGKKTVPKGCSVGAYFDKSFHWIYLFIVLLLPPGIFLPRWLSHPRKNQLGRML
jgi:hypothetical protein